MQTAFIFVIYNLKEPLHLTVKKRPRAKYRVQNPRGYVVQSEAPERVACVKTTPHYSLGHVTQQQLFIALAPRVNSL